MRSSEAVAYTLFSVFRKAEYENVEMVCVYAGLLIGVVADVLKAQSDLANCN